LEILSSILNWFQISNFKKILNIIFCSTTWFSPLAPSCSR